MAGNDGQDFKKTPVILRFLFLILLSAHSYLYAQHHRWCSSAEYLREQMLAYPHLAEKFQQAQLPLNTQQSSDKRRRALVTIPVVVHVVHDGDSIGGSENIPDAQIQSQIDALNRYYRNQNPGLSSVPLVFRTLAADFEMEFCLASRDPDGNPTTGIERINGGRTTWSQALAEQLKPSTIWDPDKYLNIWVMRLGSTNANTLGYAQFPGFPDSTDGIVIDYTAFGTIGNLLPDFNQGKTTAHEIGHWLGLFHIWGDDNGDCGMDDGVNDTPRQASENYGCPSFPHISCSNGPNGDMFMNYMDYTDDDCSSMFTAGQKAVADFTLSNFRSSILTSDGCIPTTANQRDMAIIQLIFPTEEICSEVFVPVIQVRNHGSATITSMLVNYQADNVGLNQFQWSGSLPSYAYDYIRLPKMNKSPGAHSLSVWLSSPNGGADQNTRNDQVSINFNIVSTGTGSAVPASEDFESGTMPASWLIQNVNADRQWEITSSAGTNGSLASAWFDNFTGTAGNNPRGKRDGLITPEYDFSAPEYPYLTFSVAYARRTSASQDSLIVYYSLDCGSSWRRLWAKGGSALATAAERASPFVPQPGDWQEVTVWANLLAGQSKVKFMFENYSDFGNNIYLDEFQVRQSPVGMNDFHSDEGLSIEASPNPTDGRFTLSVRLTQPADFRVELYHISGQKTDEYWVSSSKEFICHPEPGRFSSGLYFARVVTSGYNSCKKIIVTGH